MSDGGSRLPEPIKKVIDRINGPATRARERYGRFRANWYATPLLLTVIFLFLAVLPFIRNITIFGIAPIAWLSMNMLIVTLVWATAAQSWNIMSGYTGQFSFGHAAFFGLGAYGTIIASAEFGVSPWVGMLIGSLSAGLYGLFIGVVTFRYDLRGHYFALATLAFAELLRFVFQNADRLGGANGFNRPFPGQYSSPPLLPDSWSEERGLVAFQFASDLGYYYLIFVFLLVITIVSLIIRQSKLGMYFFAIREDEDAAAAVGVPTYRYKLIGVTISAALTAWAGAFWAMFRASTNPDTSFDILINVEILLPAIVGGVGTVIGPIIGSFVVTPFAEIARQSIDLHGVNQIFYGMILVLIVLYSPKGVISWPSRFVNLLRRYLGLFRPSQRGVPSDDD